MIRVVFDTNVLVSAAFKRSGIPAQVLDLITSGIVTPCVSEAVMAEYVDVLARPVLRQHAVRARELLAIMATFAEHVAPTETLTLCPDPDDNRFRECAAESGAQYLVTGNLRHFPKEHPFAVSIVTPRDLLTRLKSKPG